MKGLFIGIAMNRQRLRSCCIAAVLSLVMSGCTSREPPEQPCVLALDWDELRKLMPAGLGDQYVYAVRRSVDGSQLYVNIPGNLVTISGRGVTTMPAPGHWSFVDGKGDFVAWFDDVKKGISFPTGTRRTLTVAERFGVDPSGAYFFVSSYDTGATKLYSTAQPEVELFSIPHCVAYGLFAHKGVLFVCGTEGVSLQDALYEVGESGGAYGIRRRRELPGAVVDMLPESETVLVDNRSDLRPRWSICNLSTGARLRVSARKAVGFLVSPDLLSAVSRPSEPTATTRQKR